MILRSMNHPNLLPILTCFLAAKPSSGQPGCQNGGSSPEAAQAQAEQPAEAAQLASDSFATRGASRADDTAFASPERLVSNAQVLVAGCEQLMRRQCNWPHAD